MGGVVVVEAVYSAPVPVDLQQVTFREISLVGTRVYTPSDIDDALDLLVRGVVDAASVVSEIVVFDGVAGALEGLRQGDSLKVLVDCTGTR